MSYEVRLNCLKYSPALVFLLVFHISLAQPKKNIKEIGLDRFSDLDAEVTRNAKSLGNDIATMLWTDTLVYKHELGSFDSKTPGSLGASSALLTTVLALKLAEQGKISLDDKIGQYLPIYNSYGKSYITIRHCLTHFTGIQSDNGFFSKKKFGSLEDEVNSFAKKEIKANAGTEFSYNAMGPSIVGRILEIVAKKKFDMLIKQQLFTPLGMRKSTFSNLDGSAVNPSTGGQASAEEFMRFLQMLLNDGKYNGQEFLNTASMAEFKNIYTGNTPVRSIPKGFENIPYALGAWVIEESSDHKATAVIAPGLQGTFPIIDWCRGYAYLLIVKSPQDEPKKLMYDAFKSAIDDKLPGKCK